MLRLVRRENKSLSHLTTGLTQIQKRWNTFLSFGDGSNGALGLPTSVSVMGSDAYEPTPVPGLPSDVSAVAAGHYHSLAVTSRGQLWAWGRNNEAQLGRGFNSPRYFLHFHWIMFWNCIMCYYGFRVTGRVRVYVCSILAFCVGLFSTGI